MFNKLYKHCLDAKNRMRLPSKLRQGIVGDYYIVKGEGKWLDVLTQEQMDAKISELKKLPMHNVEIRKQIANVMGSILKVEEDVQFRFILPGNLKSHAGIDKDFVVIDGLFNIEVYSKEYWEAEIENSDMAILTEKLDEISKQDGNE